MPVCIAATRARISGADWLTQKKIRTAATEATERAMKKFLIEKKRGVKDFAG